MAYEVMILCHLHMPLYFLGTFTEYPYLFPDIYHSEQIVSTTIYTVTYTTKYNGKTKTFRSDVILKEKVSLEILLQHYEMTTIYINPKNDNQYYFDLDFLK